MNLHHLRRVTFYSRSPIVICDVISSYAVLETQARRLESQRERELLLSQLADNKRLDAESAAKYRQEMLKVRQDLLGQIDYNRRMRDAEMIEERRLDQKQVDAEVEYQRKIDYLMHKPVLDRIHPLRRHLYTASAH